MEIDEKIEQEIRKIRNEIIQFNCKYNKDLDYVTSELLHNIYLKLDGILVYGSPKYYNLKSLEEEYKYNKKLQKELRL